MWFFFHRLQDYSFLLLSALWWLRLSKRLDGRLWSPVSFIFNLSTGFPSTQLAKLETVGKARPSAPLLYKFTCLLFTTISWGYIQLKFIENLHNSGLNTFVYFSHITKSPELGSCWCPFSCPMMTWTPSVFRFHHQRGSFHPQACCLWVVRGLLYLQATYPHSRQEKWER